jgi:hypothetical protein
MTPPKQTKPMPSAPKPVTDLLATIQANSLGLGASPRAQLDTLYEAVDDLAGELYRLGAIDDTSSEWRRCA